MLITPSTLEAAYYAFDTLFQSAFKVTQPWSAAVATQASSKTAENRYFWPEMVPVMREWVGERVVQNLQARAFAIQNKDWEGTVEVARNDFEDDQLGNYDGIVQALGQAAKKLPDRLIATLMQAGSTTVCADGQYFFDTDHPVNQDNSALGTYANRYTTKALTAANYGSVRAAMRARKAANGVDTIEVVPNLLVVPPSLEDTGKAILQNDYIATAAAAAGMSANVQVSNIYKATATLLVIPELESEPTVWYLLDTTKPIKPFVWQLRRAAQFQALTAMTDENVFWRKKFIYGCDARGNAGFSLPFLAARCEA